MAKKKSQILLAVSTTEERVGSSNQLYNSVDHQNMTQRAYSTQSQQVQNNNNINGFRSRSALMGSGGSNSGNSVFSNQARRKPSVMTSSGNSILVSSGQYAPSSVATAPWATSSQFSNQSQFSSHQNSNSNNNNVLSTMSNHSSYNTDDRIRSMSGLSYANNSSFHGEDVIGSQSSSSVSSVLKDIGVGLGFSSTNSDSLFRSNNPNTVSSAMVGNESSLYDSGELRAYYDNDNQDRFSIINQTCLLDEPYAISSFPASRNSQIQDYKIFQE